jgi:hypothetical protein
VSTYTLTMPILAIEVTILSFLIQSGSAVFNAANGAFGQAGLHVLRVSVTVWLEATSCCDFSAWFNIGDCSC